MVLPYIFIQHGCYALLNSHFFVIHMFLCTSDTVTPVNDVGLSDLTSEETTYFENKDDISFVQISTPEVRSVVDQPFVYPDFDSYGVILSGKEFSDCNIFFS